MYNFLKSHKTSLVYFPLALYWIALFTATSIPSPSFPDILTFSDKVNHLVAYFGLSVLLTITFHFQEKYPLLNKYNMIWAFIIVMVYGIVDEAHQAFIPGRFFELLDWLADCIGSLIGVFTADYFLKFISKSNKPGT